MIPGTLILDSILFLVKCEEPVRVIIKKQTDQWQPTRDIEKYSMDQVSQIIDKTILHTIHHSFTPGSLVAEESNQEHANPSLLVSVKDSFFPALTLLLHRD